MRIALVTASWIASVLLADGAVDTGSLARNASASAIPPVGVAETGSAVLMRKSLQSPPSTASKDGSASDLIVASMASREKCPYWNAIGVLTDRLDVICSAGPEQLDHHRAFDPLEPESVALACCPEPYEPCGEEERVAGCDALLAKDVGVCGRHITQDEAVERLQRARAAFRDAHEDCKVFAEAQPFAKCGGKTNSSSIDREDINCEMMLWQGEQLGDGEATLFEENRCPWPGEAVANRKAYLKQRKAEHEARQLALAQVDPGRDEPEIHLVFQPGPHGMEVEHTVQENSEESGVPIHKGLVASVDQGGQAEQLGVESGWQIVSVDGKAYREQLADENAAGEKKYIVTFVEREEHPGPLRHQGSLLEDELPPFLADLVDCGADAQNGIEAASKPAPEELECTGKDACKDRRDIGSACPVGAGTRCVVTCKGENACSGSAEVIAASQKLVLKCIGKGACAGQLQLRNEANTGSAWFCCEGEGACKDGTFGAATKCSSCAACNAQVGDN